jgi:hypothetical protein
MLLLLLQLLCQLYSLLLLLLCCICCLLLQPLRVRVEALRAQRELVLSRRRDHSREHVERKWLIATIDCRNTGQVLRQFLLLLLSLG